MQMHSGIGEKRRGLGWKEFLRDPDECGVQFDQVNAFDCGMTERLRDGAAGSAADHKNATRRRMLQQRVVHRLFGGALVRGVGEDKAVFIQAADVAGFNDRQVSVDGIARCEQVKAAPLACLRGALQPRRNTNEK